MKRCFIILLGMAACVFAGASAPAQAENQFDPEKVEASIVWVQIDFDVQLHAPGDWLEGDAPGNFYDHAHVSYGCTGWFASSAGDIVTAGHCVGFDQSVKNDLIDDFYDHLKVKHPDWGEKYRAEAHEEWTVKDGNLTRKVQVGQAQGTKGPLENDSNVAQVVAWQPFTNGDNALLRVADIKSTPLQIAGATPKIGDAVTAVGFPTTTFQVEDIKRNRPSFKQGTVSSFQYSTSGVKQTEIDADVIEGMSGGPTLNETGEVVGVNSSFFRANSGSSKFITDTDALRRFVSSNGVTLETATPSASPKASGKANKAPASTPASSSKSSSSSNVLLIVVILLVLLLIALVIFFIAFQRRNKRQSATPSTVPPSSYNGDDTLH